MLRFVMWKVLIFMKVSSWKGTLLGALGESWEKIKVYKCTPCAFLAKKITVSRGTNICMYFLLTSRNLEVTEGQFFPFITKMTIPHTQ